MERVVRDGTTPTLTMESTDTMEAKEERDTMDTMDQPTPPRITTHTMEAREERDIIMDRLTRNTRKSAMRFATFQVLKEANQVREERDTTDPPTLPMTITHTMEEREAKEREAKELTTATEKEREVRDTICL